VQYERNEVRDLTRKLATSQRRKKMGTTTTRKITAKKVRLTNLCQKILDSVEDEGSTYTIERGIVKVVRRDGSLWDFTVPTRIK
jgi:hypothetical protein